MGAPLERALSLRSSGVMQSQLLAETKFALARALWGFGGEEARARRLAGEALDGYQAAPPAAVGPQLREVRQWLQANGD